MGAKRQKGSTPIFAPRFRSPFSAGVAASRKSRRKDDDFLAVWPPPPTLFARDGHVERKARETPLGACARMIFAWYSPRLSTWVATSAKTRTKVPAPFLPHAPTWVATSEETAHGRGVRPDNFRLPLQPGVPRVKKGARHIHP